MMVQLCSLSELEAAAVSFCLTLLYPCLDKNRDLYSLYSRRINTEIILKSEVLHPTDDLYFTVLLAWAG